MTQAQILEDIASYGGQAGFWAAISFPAITALYWPWWKHAWGLTIVSLDLALALALLGDVLVLEFGMSQTGLPALVFSWVEAIALCMIPCIIVWRGVLTFITQRRARGRHEDGSGSGS